MQDVLSKLEDGLTTFGPNLLAAVAILVLGWWVARLASSLVRRATQRAHLDAVLGSFLGNLSYLLVLTVVAIAALGRLGISTASFVVVVGAAGLAIGFALQGSLANFAAGVMLIAFRPFKAGDFVEAAGVSGSVNAIQVFATRLTTPDNKLVIVPNASITAGSIINYSALPRRRVDLVFGIGYGDDLKLAKDVIQSVLAGDARVLRDPAPTVAVLELGDSSVNFAVRPWVQSADYWGVRFDLTERIKRELDARGISIPFPQRDVHLHQAA